MVVADSIVELRELCRRVRALHLLTSEVIADDSGGRTITVAVVGPLHVEAWRLGVGPDGRITSERLLYRMMF